MNLRLARKILRDPHRHSAHQLLVAARRVRPGWFNPTEDPAGVAYWARSVMGDQWGSRAQRRRLRVNLAWHKGRHDDWRVPF